MRGARASHRPDPRNQCTTAKINRPPTCDIAKLTQHSRTLIQPDEAGPARLFSKRISSQAAIELVPAHCKRGRIRGLKQGRRNKTYVYVGTCACRGKLNTSSTRCTRG